MPNGTEAIKAEYKDMILDEYNSNPLIQALPVILDRDEIIKKLYTGFKFSEKERNLNSTLKIHLLKRLYNIFLPLPKHLEVWNIIDSLIRQGYVARNPFSKEYKMYLNEIGREFTERKFDLNRSSKNFVTTASCGIILGFSGMGKTTTVNKVLEYIPQVIYHNSYEGRHYNQIQLAWLKLEAPHNGSLKALCLQYFMKIDELLGTDNFKKYVSRNLSVDSMLPIMGKLAQSIGLGLLVIDELQHLNKNTNSIMKYFVTLINSFGVPLVFVGTTACYSFLQQEFRIARRVTGNGECIWNNMDKSDEFRLFIKGVWNYQIMDEEVALTDEIIDIFYEKTQGISDLVIKLFINTQKKALILGESRLSIKLINAVAEEEFVLMKPMLEALKSGNEYKIEQYEDIRKIEKKVKNTSSDKENIPTNNIKGKNYKRSSKELEDEDIRKIIAEGKKKEESPYKILLANNIIDDMEFWGGV